MDWRLFFVFGLFSTLFCSVFSQNSDNVVVKASGEVGGSSQSELYRIEGKVFPLDGQPLTNAFLVETKVIANYGQYSGFLR